MKNYYRNTINFFVDKIETDPNELQKRNGLKYDKETEYMKYRICNTFKETEEALQDHIDNIFTTSLINLSFDLIEFGYDIYIESENVRIQLTPGMSIDNDKELRYGHNLRRILLGHALDDILQINDWHKVL